MYEASERDFRVVCVEDAISGMYDQGRRELDNIGVLRLSAASVAESVERASWFSSYAPATPAEARWQRGSSGT